MAKIELRRVDRTKPKSAFIRNFASNVTSQFGEDGMIAKVFELLGTKNKWCVEFGAWDGKYLSNTWNLLENEGWSGVLIESNELRAERLVAAYRSKSHRVCVKRAMVGWEGDSALDEILDSTGAPRNFDLLSIDIDGNDWHVWKALERFRPRLVIIEFNQSATNELYFVQDPDQSLNQGSSLLAFVELAKSKRYELIATTLVNAFFVVAEEYGRLGIEDNSIDALHACTYDTQICHGYDGTIFGAGNMRLNWHNLQLTQDDLQVLPTAMRKYPDPG